MTELTHLRQVNSELNAQLRAARLQISQLKTELAEARDLLSGLGVKTTTYPVRGEVLLIEDDADPLEELTYVA